MAADGTPDSRNLSTPATNPLGEASGDSPTTPVLASPPSTAGPGGQPWILAKSILPGYTIRRTVPEVRVQFSVADEHGKLSTNLSANDIRIFDNQYAVQRIRQFSRLDDLPLQIGILLDVSDSVRNNIVHKKLATRILVEQVLRSQTDRAFLVGFGREVKLWQPSTGDSAALRNALERIQQLGYTTNLYDGLFAACAGQFPQTGEHEVAQRVIVLFSDGDDTGSLHGMPAVIALAQRNEVQIFALSTHPQRKPAPGDDVLRRLADETGGHFYVARSDKEFPAIFAEMEQQMRTQYAVSFQPQQDTPGFHALRVELSSPQKVRVHARQGYYVEGP